MFWDDTTSKDTTTDTCDIFYSVILWDLEELTKMRTWRQIRKLPDDL